MSPNTPTRPCSIRGIDYDQKFTRQLSHSPSALAGVLGLPDTSALHTLYYEDAATKPIFESYLTYRQNHPQRPRQRKRRIQIQIQTPEPTPTPTPGCSAPTQQPASAGTRTQPLAALARVRLEPRQLLSYAQNLQYRRAFLDGRARPTVGRDGVTARNVDVIMTLWYIVRVMRAKPALFPRTDFAGPTEEEGCRCHLDRCHLDQYDVYHGLKLLAHLGVREGTARKARNAKKAVRPVFHRGAGAGMEMDEVKAEVEVEAEADEGMGSRADGPALDTECMVDGMRAGDGDGSREALGPVNTAGKDAGECPVEGGVKAKVERNELVEVEGDQMECC
ncbi:hypothetical protein BJX61DRAFT_540513 [Aspergillus egyptiacus]|nr:hypothetical protein BJX61DRAFT_540513 [Aspergillus egyptiacus]